MSKQTFEELLAWTTADGTAVANTTTETILLPNITIPANFMQDGRVIRYMAFGRISTTGTPTIQFRTRFGGVAGTVIMTSGAMTNGSGVTNLCWEISGTIITRTNGSSGTLFGMADYTVNTSSTASLCIIGGSAGTATPAAATVDLTVDEAFALTAQWSAASASNTITLHKFNLEGLN